MRRTVTFIMTCLLICATVPLGYGHDEERHTAKIKAQIEKLGTGPDARIEVKFADGHRTSGYLGEINSADFVIVTADNQRVSVPYPSAKKVTGNNLSTGVKIAIGIAIAVVIFAIIGASARD